MNFYFFIRKKLWAHDFSFFFRGSVLGLTTVWGLKLVLELRYKINRKNKSIKIVEKIIKAILLKCSSGNVVVKCSNTSQSDQAAIR